MKKVLRVRRVVLVGSVVALCVSVAAVTVAMSAGAQGSSWSSSHQGASLTGIATTAFPSAGTDVFDSSADVVVQPGCSGSDIPLFLEGPTHVQRGNPTVNASSQRTIATQITSLGLTGFDPNFGHMSITVNPTMPSNGQVTANGPSTGPDFPASSFFDVFIEINTSGGTFPPMQLHNDQPAVMQATNIMTIPPIGTPYTGETGIPLKNSSGTVVACVVSARHTPSIDHFLCYQAKTIPSSLAPGFKPPASVTLANQLNTVGFSAKPVAVTTHCNPVQKTLPSGQVTPVSNPAAHLLCWSITTSVQPAAKVVVNNQFGTAQLNVGQPKTLCLPSWKRLKVPPKMTPNQPPALDHLTCYPVSYVPGTPPFGQIPPFVNLKDQFGSYKVKVGVPTVLCVPTQKTVNSAVFPITNSIDHLLCFAVSALKSAKPFDQNQFGTGQLSLSKVTSLCLQSEKTKV